MKISSASKKVLASALSAAMVVAFAPTVAFGAQAGNKIKVEYDLAGGSDSAAEFQGAITTEEYTAAPEYGTIEQVNDSSVVTDAKGIVIKSNTGTPALGTQLYTDSTCTTKVAEVYDYRDDDNLLTAYPTYFKPVVAGTANITLESGANLKLKSGLGSYDFAGWKVTFDANGDGDFDDAAQGDIKKTIASADSRVLSVAHSNIHPGAVISAKAYYDTATIAANALAIDNNGDATHGYATVTFNKTSISNASKAVNGAIVEVAGPNTSGSLDLSSTTESQIVLPAAVGEYTVTLKDGNGTVLDTQKMMVGSVVLTGGYFKNVFTSGNTYVGSQAIYYKATSAKQDVDAIINAYDSEVGAGYTTPYKKAGDSTTNGTIVKVPAQVAAGAVSTELVATFASDEASILGMTYAAGNVTIAYNNQIIKNAAGQQWLASGQSFNAPATSTETGYYLVVKDADGKIVAETVQTGTTNKNFGTVGYSGTLTFATTGSTSYTATLYKVTAAAAGTPGLADGVAGTVKDLGSKTVEVKAVAAPTWSYAANEKVADGGTLTLGNAAGEGFEVKYSMDNGVTWKTYDTAKGGISKVTATDVKIQSKATAANTKADPSESAVVTLNRYTNAKQAFDNWATAFVAYKAINGAPTTYYGNEAGVKAAIEAADAAFVSTGYVAAQGSTVDLSINATPINVDKAWATAVTAAKKSVVDAVAEAAKAEAGKMLAGTADTKTGDLTKISEDNYKKAISSIDAAVAAFAANHDADTTNNVAQYTKADGTKANYSDTTGSYIEAIDTALLVASKATVTYKKADVDAATAVSAQLKDPKTAAAGLEAYAALTAAQKELVAAADIAAAEAIVAKQAVVDAQDEGTLNKISTTKKLTFTAKKAKTTKARYITYTTKVSKSGNAVVYAKKSGSSKITVAASGKVTLKKGAVKGKTYTAKVTATCGTQTRTVNVKFIVK